MDNRVPARIHWFSIINSLLIIFFLSALVGMILIKNLKRDISQYNSVLTDEEKAEEVRKWRRGEECRILSTNTAPPPPQPSVAARGVWLEARPRRRLPPPS